VIVPVPPVAVTGANGVIAVFSIVVDVAAAVVATRAAITSKVKVECAVAPAASIPVTVYVPEAAGDVGVPVIWPVEVLRVSPAGRAGDTE
jgi:hypothetical protein